VTGKNTIPPTLDQFEMYVFILQQENNTQNMSVERLNYTTNF